MGRARPCRRMQAADVFRTIIPLWFQNRFHDGQCWVTSGEVHYRKQLEPLGLAKVRDQFSREAEFPCRRMLASCGARGSFWQSSECCICISRSGVPSDRSPHRNSSALIFIRDQVSRNSSPSMGDLNSAWHCSFCCRLFDRHRLAIRCFVAC